MKKSIISILMGMLLVGCQEAEIRTEVSDAKNIFSTEMEVFGNATRTSMTSDFDVVWSEGDQLTIFRGSYMGDKYQVVSQYVGKPYGDFQLIGEDASGNDFSSGTELQANVAVYPYGDDYTLAKKVVGEKVSYTVSGVEFLAAQQYAENSFGYESFLMAAVTESLSDHKLKFKNIGGALKLQLKGEGVVKSISVKGNNDENLAGVADVTVSSSSVPAFEFTSPSKEVILNCGTNGVTLKSSEVTNFIISLPVVNFTKGFTVTITDIDGKTDELSTTNPNEIKRSGILKMPEKVVTFDSQTPSVPQMYIGYVPIATAEKYNIADETFYSKITKEIINEGITSGAITQTAAAARTDDYTGFGDVPAESVLIILLPQSSGLKANKWNVISKDCDFSVEPVSNGENVITLDGEKYAVYGEITIYQLIKGSKEIYYKIKPKPLPMYIGYIPYETLVENDLYNWEGYANLTEDVINEGVSKGEIKKMDAKAVTENYTAFGNVPRYAFTVIILPQSSGLTATAWNVIEGDVPFTVNPHSNGENTMSINGETYLVFGERAKYELVAGENDVFYKIK